MVWRYVWAWKAASRWASKSCESGLAEFLLYSPSTASASVRNSGSAYRSRWKRSASTRIISSRSSLVNVVW